MDHLCKDNMFRAATPSARTHFPFSGGARASRPGWRCHDLLRRRRGPSSPGVGVRGGRGLSNYQRVFGLGLGQGEGASIPTFWGFPTGPCVIAGSLVWVGS